MKSVRVFLFATCCTALIAASGCGSAAPTAAPPSPVSVGTAAAQQTNAITASAEVEPAQVSDMAFLIAGRVKEVLVSEGDQVKAGQVLVVLEAPELEYAAVSAQAEADSAEINQFLQRSTRDYKVWNGRRWIWTHGLPEVRQIADARLQKALGSLEVAQAELAQASLVAPYDGTVVSIDAVPGEVIEPQQTVLQLGDLNRLQIATTDLSERDVARLRLGQAASVQVKAFANPLSGRLSSIGVMAEKSEDGDTVFKVIVDLDEQPAGLLWGMTGEVRIDSSD